MKKNGVNQLEEGMEQMRMTVVEMELKARYWKAQVDIREETLRYDAMEDQYNEYIEKRQKSLEALKEELQKETEVTDEQSKL